MHRLSGMRVPSVYILAIFRNRCSCGREMDGQWPCGCEPVKYSLKKDSSPDVVGEAEPGAPVSSAMAQENEFLKRKVNQLVAEVNTLKNENSVLKDKLSQIKKIA